MLSVEPLVTGVIFTFTFHMRYNYSSSLAKRVGAEIA
jgi:hypothetical protein